MKEILLDYFKRVDIMKTVTGLIILAVFCYLVSKIVTQELPETNREIVIHVLGIIEGAVMAIVTYYFGSSKGSQHKQEILDKQTAPK